jgi:hypothetical protein
MVPSRMGSVWAGTRPQQFSTILSFLMSQGHGVPLPDGFRSEECENLTRHAVMRRVRGWSNHYSSRGCCCSNLPSPVTVTGQDAVHGCQQQGVPLAHQLVGGSHHRKRLVSYMDLALLTHKAHISEFIQPYIEKCLKRMHLN